MNFPVFPSTAPLFAVGAFFIALAAGNSARADTPPAEWTPLLDVNLSQWEPFIGVPGKGVKVPGVALAKGKPLGLRDPKGVFTASLVDGEPVLKVSGEIVGGLTTLKSYENYRLRLQFRWKKKRWPPRTNAPRDSGILYHCVGEHGAYSNVWMRSVELQIQENDIGDFYPLCGSGADFPAKLDGKFPRYTPGAALVPGFERVMRGADYQEKPFGEWNDVELVVVGADSAHILNGRVVNELRNIRYREGKGGAKTKATKTPAGTAGTAAPATQAATKTPTETLLTSGKLQIQSEFADIEFRRIEIKRETTLPTPPAR